MSAPSLVGPQITATNLAQSLAGVAPVIKTTGRATAQTNVINASVATFTVGASDGSFEVQSNVLVTATTVAAMTVTCVYTDEGNTSRTLTLPFLLLAGTLVTSITNAQGAIAYEGITQRIRCKTGTAITVATAGTVTGITYNVEATITQIA
jgi:hypothetical protein